MIALAFFVACVGARNAVETDPVAQLEQGQFLLAHTNDLHAHFLPDHADWMPDKPSIGGFVALDAHVQSIRSVYGDDAVVLLDGGDILTGTPLMEVQAHGAFGGGMVELMEGVGYDAWVVGNHEFDRGFDNAASLVEHSGIPVVGANLDAAGSEAAGGLPALPGLRDHVVIETNGLRVGVFGLTTEGLFHLASPATMSRIDVRPLVETAKQQVDQLEGEVDLVVALTHIGVEQDRKLAGQVEGIDLIVGGHSHTRMTEYERVGDTIIVQAGSYGRQLGLWEVTVDDGSISEMTGGLVDLWPDDLPHPASEQVSGLVAEWQNRIDETFALSVGSLEGDLMRKPGPESTMGMWATDMVRVGAQADIGMYNAGGLRADLLAGPLTRGDVYQVFPFSNKLVRFELTGAELVGLLLRGANAQLKGHRPLLWSGVRFEWAEVGGAPDLRSVHIGGKPLELEASYTIGTNSYVAQQWEHLLGVEPRALMAFEESVFESAVRFASEGPVSIPHDPRNVFVQQ